MTYLRLEDGHTFLNTSHIAKVDHFDSALEDTPYTRLILVGLSSSVTIRGIVDIEAFLTRLDTSEPIVDVTGFFE
jgi:hypothetical protein